MSLEKILKKIGDDSQEEADLIIQESLKKADQILETAKTEGTNLAESFIQENQRQSQLEASRLVTQARLEQKINILTCKKELINLVFEKAFQNEMSERKEIKRIVVEKDGEREELFDEQQLRSELRPRLEKVIASALKL
jgi:vacuolar-type H+-ATPase subunit H